VATVPPRSEVLSIGYISLDASLLYDQAVSAGVRDAAARAGVDLVGCDPGWTRDGVIACATQLAQAGVHGVISFQPFADLAPDVCAITGEALTVGVVFDQGRCQVSRMGIDQAASGRLAGEAVGAYVSDRWQCEVNAYISLESSDADPDGRARMQGYRDGYAAHCPMPEPAITLDGADRLVTAQTQVAGVLDDLKGRPNIVVGLNEDAILGAMAAATAAERENHFWYSGQLADPAIRGHIACNERYIASVAQFPERFGDVVVPTLLGALAGDDVPGELMAELQLVTSTNVRQLFPDTISCDEWSTLG
jgi:ribose transport system substrate-binding protein